MKLDVAVDSKSYELALVYLGAYWKQLNSMTADEVDELTRMFALEIRDCAIKFLDRERELRFLEREKSAHEEKISGVGD